MWGLCVPWLAALCVSLGPRRAVPYASAVLALPAGHIQHYRAWACAQRVPHDQAWLPGGTAPAAGVGAGRRVDDNLAPGGVTHVLALAHILPTIPCGKALAQARWVQCWCGAVACAAGAAGRAMVGHTQLSQLGELGHGEAVRSYVEHCAMQAVEHMLPAAKEA